MAAVEYQDIVCVATEAGRFATLASALRLTGLDEVLKSAGRQARERLTALLRRHVVNGIVPAAEVATLSAITPLHGPPLAVSTSRSGITVGGADVITTDLDASNGVIHVIDRVLL